MPKPNEEKKADNKVRAFMPFCYIDDEKRMVYGYGATTTAPSSGKEPITIEAIKNGLPEWLKYRNVREMHQLSAVGRAVEVATDEKGVYLGTYVGDDQAWQKVKSGIYQGYSIGGNKVEVKDGKITILDIEEFSLVDRPDITDSKFDMWRSDGTVNIPHESPVELFARAVGNVKASFDAIQAIAKNKNVERRLHVLRAMVESLEQMVHIGDHAKFDAAQGAKPGSGQVAMLVEQAINAVSDFVGQIADIELAEYGGTPATDGTAVAATATPKDLLRKGASLSKGTAVKLREAYRILSSLLGFKAQNDAEMDESRGAHEKDEADRVKAEAETAKRQEAEEKEKAAEAERKKKEAAAHENETDEEKKKREEAERAKHDEDEENRKAEAKRLEDEEAERKRVQSAAGTIETLTREVKELTEKVERLNSTIMPAKTGGKLQVVSKEDDTTVDNRSDEVKRAYTEAVKNNDIQTMIKMKLAGLAPNNGNLTKI